MSRKKSPIDGRMVKKLEVDNEIIEVVPKVCYLVDIFSACCDHDPFAITVCCNKLLASLANCLPSLPTFSAASDKR